MEELNSHRVFQALPFLPFWQLTLLRGCGRMEQLCSSSLGWRTGEAHGHWSLQDCHKTMLTALRFSLKPMKGDKKWTSATERQYPFKDVMTYFLKHLLLECSITKRVPAWQCIPAPALYASLLHLWRTDIYNVIVLNYLGSFMSKYAPFKNTFFIKMYKAKKCNMFWALDQKTLVRSFSHVTS